MEISSGSGRRRSMEIRRRLVPRLQKNCLKNISTRWLGWASCEAVVVFTAGLFARHDAVDLAEFRWQPLFLRELVLEECHGQLLVVLHRVQVKLVERVICVEFVRVQLQEKTFCEDFLLSISILALTLDSSLSIAFIS